MSTDLTNYAIQLGQHAREAGLNLAATSVDSRSRAADPRPPVMSRWRRYS